MGRSSLRLRAVTATKRPQAALCSPLMPKACKPDKRRLNVMRVFNPTFMETSNVSFANLFGADAVTIVTTPQNGSFIAAIAGSNGNKATTSGVVFTFNAKGLQAGQTTIECNARV